MSQLLALVAYLVREYDEAIAYFTQRLGFELLEDTPREPGKRWVRVAPPLLTRDSGRAAAELGARSALLLAKAATPEQQSFIGNQGGGRVWLFLETADFARDFAAFQARGVEFLEVPREEPYGTVAVFRDLYGNRWDLIQPRAR